MVLGLELFQSRSTDSYNQDFSHTWLYMMELVIAPFYSGATNAPVKTTRKDLELAVSLALKIVLFILSEGNLLSTYYVGRHWVRSWLYNSKYNNKNIEAVFSMSLTFLSNFSSNLFLQYFFKVLNCGRQKMF